MPIDILDTMHILPELCLEAKWILRCWLHGQFQFVLENYFDSTYSLSRGLLCLLAAASKVLHQAERRISPVAEAQSSEESMAQRPALAKVVKVQIRLQSVEVATEVAAALAEHQIHSCQ